MLNSKILMAILPTTLAGLLVIALSACSSGGGGNGGATTGPTGTLYYVDSAATDDSGDGLTPATAKQTIMAAIDAATAPASVLVNAGTYTVNSDPAVATHIVMKEGVSLYGGYNADFSARDFGTNTTTIQDISTYITAASERNRAIEASVGITNATIIDGFHIEGSSLADGATVCALSVEQFAEVIIRNNTIVGSSNPLTGSAIGIYILVASPTINTNTISSGDSVSGAFGIVNLGGSPQVSLNTISSGSSTTSYGVHNNLGANATINLNTISSGNAADVSAGIANIDSTGTNSSNTISTGNAGNEAYGILGINSNVITITDNLITGVTTIGATTSYGIHSRKVLNVEPAIPGNDVIIADNIITLGVGNNTYGVHLEDHINVSFNNNSIDGGTSLANNSYGVYLDGIEGSLAGNSIFGGVSNSSSTGVYLLNDADVTLNNNLIHAGAANPSNSGQSYGIYNSGSSPAILNNTIYSGTGLARTSIYNHYVAPLSASIPAIQNNIIFGQEGTCVDEQGVLSDPIQITNNNVFGCTTLYNDNDSAVMMTELDITGNFTDGIGTFLTTPVAFDNVSIDMAGFFVDIDGPDNNMDTMSDNDWRLSAGTPASVTEGGLNGIDNAWTFSDDFDGNSRPASGMAWSMGAFN